MIGALINSFRRYVTKRGQESTTLALLSFLITVLASRGSAHAIRAGIGPFRSASVGGTQLHHSFWGILSLLALGYGQLLKIGATAESSRVPKWGVAIVYGSAAALTLDEFALWLHLGKSYKPRNDYWNREGRKSIWAVMAFGSLLLATMLVTSLKRRLSEKSEEGGEKTDRPQSAD